MSQKTLLESRDDIQFAQEVQQAFGVTIAGRVLTTDAVPTTLLTLPLSPETTTVIRAQVLARRTSGIAGVAEDGASYVIYGVFKMIAGVATLIGALASLLTAEDQAGWDATLIVSGGRVLVQVTGAADNNITWNGKVNIDSVSN